MRILAHDEWLASCVTGNGVSLATTLAGHGTATLLIAELAALLEPFYRRIHRRIYIRVFVAALPVDWARRIDLLHRSDRMAETVAVPCLVAHRPERDRRIVAVEDSLALVALDNRMLPFLKAAKPIVAVSWLVPLDVRLGYHVDSIPVAEVVPETVVGIVAGADGVDIVLLEERDVLQHVVHGDGAAVLGIRLVAVHALHLDRHPVHEESVADYSLLLEPDLLRADVAALLHDERVEIGVFCAPEMSV